MDEKSLSSLFFHINTSDSHVYTVFGYGEPIGVAFTKILQIFHDFFREKWHFQGKIWSKLGLYCRYDFSSIRSSKNAFFAFYEVFWGRKIFWTPESCFLAIFTPRNDVFEKKIFEKFAQKRAKSRFFFGTPCIGIVCRCIVAIAAVVYGAIQAFIDR